MTDNLVKRLRELTPMEQAIDRIVALEAALSDLIEEAYEEIPQRYIKKAYSVLTGDKNDDP